MTTTFKLCPVLPALFALSCGADSDDATQRDELQSDDPSEEKAGESGCPESGRNKVFSASKCLE